MNEARWPRSGIKTHIPVSAKVLYGMVKQNVLVVFHTVTDRFVSDKDRPPTGTSTERVNESSRIPIVKNTAPSTHLQLRLHPRGIPVFSNRQSTY